MAKDISGLKHFEPGKSGNPGGKPAGARNRITAHFLNQLADDFKEHGKSVIAACRTERPDVYLKVVAALVPKEVQITRPLEGLTDDELLAIAEQLRSQVGTEPGRAGTEAPQVLPTAH